MPTSATLADEVTYLGGINAGGKVAATSFRTWTLDTAPATYGASSSVAKWGSTTSGTAGGTVSYYFDPASSWTAVEKAAFTDVFALWSAVANISFSSVTTAPAAGITLTRGSGTGAYAQSSLSGTSGSGSVGGTKTWTITGSTISIDTSVPGFGPIGSSFTTGGGYPWTTMLHEIGHSLGLGHTGPYNEGDGIDPTTHQYSAYDSQLYSIMSYIDPRDSNATYYSQYAVTGTDWGNVINDTLIWSNSPTTWMPLDILALQSLYGTPVSTPLSGGQTFGFNAAGFGGTAGQEIENFFDFTKNTDPVITIWDEGTGNTLDLSGFSTASTVNLNPGTYSSAGTAVSDNGATTIDMVNNIAIAYDTAIDTIITGSGNDIITGNNDGDIFEAGTGSNTLYGGSGIDTAVMTGAAASYTITHNADGSETVAKSGESDTLWHFEKIEFSDRTIPLATVHGDFNADGNSDILMQNTASGQAEIWFMDGGARLSGSGKAGANPGTDYKVVGAGDFNGDGKADIVWQKNTGQVSVWFMDGTAKIGGGSAGSNPGTAYTFLGVGDFDGDGKSDLLWEKNSTGQLSVWLMNGTTKTGGGSVGAPLSSKYKIVGTGDFNGDGKSDIVLQNTSTGQATIWLMDGTTKLSGSGTVATAPGAGYKVVGVGDFDGDGKSDLLWENTANSQLSIWFMDGATRTSHGTVSTLAAGRQVVAVGDYNGDGKADILIQTASSGNLVEYLMNGTTKLSVAVSSAPSTSWHVVSG